MIIFFDNKGAILKFNNETDLIWKKITTQKLNKKWDLF